MLPLLTDHWKDLLEIAGVFGGLWKFFDSRKNELAWKRTETLVTLGQAFAADPDISQATQLIEGRLDGAHVDQLYDDRGDPYDNLHGLRLWQVDKYLNFLERVAYAYRRMHTMSLEEVAIFGGYFQQVRYNTRLQRYCLDHGYASVVEVAAEIDALPYARRRGGSRRP